jgi:hypothetical protein
MASSPTRPWQEVSLDFITQLPPSYIGTGEYDAILVVVDRKFIPTRGDIDAAQFAALFHEQIELNFGAPRGVCQTEIQRLPQSFRQRFVSTR